MGSGNCGWVPHTKSGSSQDPTRQWKSTYAAFLVVCFYSVSTHFKKHARQIGSFPHLGVARISYKKWVLRPISTKIFEHIYHHQRCLKHSQPQNSPKFQRDFPIFRHPSHAAAPSWSPGLRPAPMHLPWSGRSTSPLNPPTELWGRSLKSRFVDASEIPGKTHQLKYGYIWNPIWGFPKIGVPQNGWFIWKTLLKWIDMDWTTLRIIGPSQWKGERTCINDAGVFGHQNSQFWGSNDP